MGKELVALILERETAVEAQAALVTIAAMKAAGVRDSYLCHAAKVGAALDFWDRDRSSAINAVLTHRID